MPLGRAQYGRSIVGRRLLAAAQAWEFRTLSLRETVWFYSVGLITAAMLFWSPSQATPPPPNASSTATPAACEWSSEAIDELGGVLGSLPEADGTSGTELLATRARDSAPSFRIRRGGRYDGRPATAATVVELRARTTDAHAPAVVGQGTRTPRRSVRVFADPVVNSTTSSPN